MPNQPPKRGARPSPRSALAGATPYRTYALVAPNFLKKPDKISFWGNDIHGDCVTAEEAFAKACSNPEVHISDDEAIAWATEHGALEGAIVTDVMTWMQNDGFGGGSSLHDDGPYLSIDWTDAAILRSAISKGPVKLGVAADQIEKAWEAGAGDRAGSVLDGNKTRASRTTASPCAATGRFPGWPGSLASRYPPEPTAGSPDTRCSPGARSASSTCPR